MTERRALGKGISALIPEKEATQQENMPLLKLEQIRPNPFQPREEFEPEGLDELTQSIREKGIIQPVLVRRRGDYYELIAGERRFRAAQMLKLEEIPAIIKDVEDEDSLELSLIENIQRQDLNPIEEAKAYKYLIDKFNLTQERVSEVLGKARVSITNTMRLLNLPQEVQQEMRKGRISFAHGKALLELSDANQQRRLAQQIISNHLSVNELENLIKKHRPKAAAPKARRTASEPYVAVLEEELQQILATKVRISKRKKRGHITVEFYSEEDLERIVKRIRGGKD